MLEQGAKLYHGGGIPASEFGGPTDGGSSFGLPGVRELSSVKLGNDPESLVAYMGRFCCVFPFELILAAYFVCCC